MALALLIVSLLFVFTIYLVIRASVTKSEKLELAPSHIREASAFLKWIAFASPLVMLIGEMVNVYDMTLKRGMNGSFDAVFPYQMLMEFIIFMLIALTVSLFALVGIGLIFLRKHRRKKQAR